MKFKGFAGMDRSGSSGNFPLVIAAIISKNKNQINECYESIFRLAAKINPIFSSRREIKSRDFGNTHQRKSVMKIMSEFEISFNVLFVKNEISEIIKKYSAKYKYYQKIEACFWFECLRVAATRCGIFPQVIFVDETYSGKDQELFVSVIKNLAEKRLMLSPVMETADSRFENAVKLADLAAGFFKADSNIQNTYRKSLLSLDSRIIAEYIEEELR
ncbi:MAG: hypothetical protein WA139_04670 [Candidatus Aenigmatarchaeota archaeon]